MEVMQVLTRGDPQTSFVEAATAHDCDLAVVGLVQCSTFPTCAFNKLTHASPAHAASERSSVL
eukprot:2730112-Rhodomonas_salina.5